MSDLKKFVESNFADNFAKWAKIQITDAMDRWGQRQCLAFAEWLRQSGNLEVLKSCDKHKVRILYKNFENEKQK